MSSAVCEAIAATTVHAPVGAACPSSTSVAIRRVARAASEDRPRRRPAPGRELVVVTRAPVARTSDPASAQVRDMQARPTGTGSPNSERVVCETTAVGRPRSSTKIFSVAGTPLRPSPRSCSAQGVAGGHRASTTHRLPVPEQADAVQFLLRQCHSHQRPALHRARTRPRSSATNRSPLEAPSPVDRRSGTCSGPNSDPVMMPNNAGAHHPCHRGRLAAALLQVAVPHLRLVRPAATARHVVAARCLRKPAGRSRAPGDRRQVRAPAGPRRAVASGTRAARAAGHRGRAASTSSSHRPPYGHRPRTRWRGEQAGS